MCGIYRLRDGSVLISGIDYEPTGPGGLLSKILMRLSPELASRSAGRFAIEILQHTQTIDARHWESKDALPLLWSMAGVKTGRALESEAKYLHVLWRDEEIKITPTKSNPGRGYEHLSQLAKVVASESQALQNAIEISFGLCE